ncbi:stalk domain-containing protein [Paenibacillus zanthoxyli]|uniref:stalk domain-containing protein n=1 Tax=Paenibacillus zanthoxyli TaxID=369399 RepID=UPI0004712518|nr:stalk domain-containing protein [Paenibacillus zanthoxyli]
MKHWGRLLLCGALLLGSVPAAAPKTVSAAGGVSIILDGYPLPFPVEPVVMNGTTMVAFRAISEALGITVKWNQSAKKITAVGDEELASKQVILTLGSKTALVDGKAVKLAVAPQTVRGTTMIPLSFFSQQFGAAVSWTQSAKTVAITSPKKDMYTLGFYAISSYSEYALLPGFDDVAFGWSRIDKDGQFTTAGADYYLPQAAGDVTPESIVQNTAAAGKTPYLMVYSGDDKLELTKNLEDKSLQDQTIGKIVDTAVQKGFKGIMLDLEGLGLTGDKAKVRSDYNAFVKNVSGKARAQGLKIGIALHPMNSSYAGYDYKTLASLADELVIMAYAYEDQKRPEPTDKVDEAIRLALKQTTKDKLVLGISLASENEGSVNTKIGLAKRYDLKGIAIWRLGLIGQAAWSEMNKSVELGG